MLEVSQGHGGAARTVGSEIWLQSSVKFGDAQSRRSILLAGVAGIFMTALANVALCCSANSAAGSIRCRVSMFRATWLRFSLHQTCQVVVSVVLMLAAFPALAVHYGFPGNLPAGCSGSQGSYTCGALTLGLGDTISITTTTTVIVNGAFTTGTGVQINPGGNGSDLSFAVAGTTDIGANSTINANIMSAGVVTLGDSNSFNGNITTKEAAINIGNLSVVNGSLASTVAGVITVGTNNRVTGNVSTLSGAIKIGANTRIDGSLITAKAGVITIGAGVTVGGNISTVSGAINIGAQTNIAGYILNTVAGAITAGEQSRVGGVVGTNSGAITLGTGSTFGGSICTGEAGAITLNDNVNVAGKLFTNDGAITVGNLSNITGTVKAVIGAVTIAPTAKVGGAATGLRCPSDPAPPAPKPQVIKSRDWRQIYMR